MTNLIMHDICSLVGSMCHTSHDQNNNFDQSYYDSNYLNHLTIHLRQDWNTRIQDSILEIVENRS
jgi:hypothetical protein